VVRAPRRQCPRLRHQPRAAPTFYEHADHSLLEAHLLDFDGDLYGERAEVRFVHFLRSERKFDGVDALIAQLKHDIESARHVLGL
jgi:riboflavin kinase/FMN adenylyltransferase